MNFFCQAAVFKNKPPVREAKLFNPRPFFFHLFYCVVAEGLQLLGSKPEGAARPGAGQQQQPASRQQPPPPGRRTAPARDPDLDVEPDEIPFKAQVRTDAKLWRGRRRFFA